MARLSMRDATGRALRIAPRKGGPHSLHATLPPLKPGLGLSVGCGEAGEFKKPGRKLPQRFGSQVPQRGDHLSHVVVPQFGSGGDRKGLDRPPTIDRAAWYGSGGIG